MRKILLLILIASVLCSAGKAQSISEPPISRDVFDRSFDAILKKRLPAQRRKGIRTLIDTYVRKRGVDFELSSADKESLRKRWGKNDVQLVEELIAAVDGKPPTQPPPPNRLKVTSEKVLATIPNDFLPVEPNQWHEVFSPDGTTVAFVARQGIKEFVVVNGTKLSEFDGIRELVLNHNAQRIAYIAKKARDVDSVYVLVINQRPGSEYADIKQPMFSPDGKRVTYFAKKKKDDKWGLYITDGDAQNEKALGTATVYDVDTRPVFSPDSSRISYVAWAGSEYKYGGKRSLFIDEKEIDRAIAFREPVFSLDGNKLAVGKYDERAERIVIYDLRSQANVKEGPSDYLEIQTPVFNADGEKLLYARGGCSAPSFRMMIVIADSIGPVYRCIKFPTFSPDSRRIAYVAVEIVRWAVVVDGKRGEEFEDVGELVFSPDSKNIAYSVKQDDKFSVVVNDKIGPEFDGVSQLVFSQDGKSLEFGAREGKKFSWKRMSAQ